MSTDFEKGLRKTIDLSVKSKDFTADVLRSAMQDFLSGKSQRKGRVSMKKLSEHSGKLENVEIKGIADFLSVAKKYDIDYAVKKEADSDTFHVFFQAGKMEDFLEAFEAGSDAALAASVFHFGEIAIPDLKKYLAAHGIPVRI